MAKLHKGRVVVIDATKDWQRHTTLCNRMSGKGSDGMNIADTDDAVTCLLCRQIMQHQAATP
jgi:hypothetical protein